MTLLRSFIKFDYQKHLFRAYSNQKTWKEVTIPVPWGEVRGKWWGPTDVRPVLTLHGWQDNCGSFDRLIPLLNNNIGFLALDFPGHGYSSRLPPGIIYHFPLYLSTIKYVKKYLNWSKISFMAHSMGGITSFTYTMLYPNEVDFIICIDGVKPLAPVIKRNRLAKTLDKFLKNNEFLTKDDEPPSYSISEIENKIHQPNQGSIDIECAKYLMERNIAPSKIHPGKYYFTRDPRLKTYEVGFVLQDEILECTQHINCPIFISKALEAHYFEPKENFYEVLDVLKRVSIDCQYHYVQGKHHVHLNNPEAELAGLIKTFINKHNIEDRSIGGLKEEMVVS